MNLVLRVEGLDCARILLEQHGIEYFYGLPYGYKGTMDWLTGIQQSLGLVGNKSYMERQAKKHKENIIRWRVYTRRQKPLNAAVSGNYDFVLSICRFLEAELGINIVAAFVNHSLDNAEREKVIFKGQIMVNC